MWIGPSSPVVELQDFFQRGDAAVVHVRRSQRRIPQRRRLERTGILRASADEDPAGVRVRVIAPGNAGVVKAFVAEERRLVTADAPRLEAEKLDASPRLGCHCG